MLQLSRRPIGLAMYSELTENVAHYLSSFAEVINAGASRVEDLRGWIIRDVEVFKAGTWRGIAYTEDDVQAIVDNFYALKGKLDPVFKVNHSEDAKDQVGWILDIRKSGDILLADIHVTEWEAYDKITNGTWKKVSAEIYLPELAETEFGVRSHILRAVAIVSIPQVKDIKGIVLNSEAWDPKDPEKPKTEGSRFKMDFEQFLQMLSEAGIQLSDEQKATLKEKGVAAFTETPAATQQVVVNVADFVTLAEQITALKASEKDMTQQLSELLSKSKKTEIATWFDGVIAAGKALPAERDKVLALAEKLGPDDLASYKETFDSRPKLVDLGQHGENGGDPDDDEKTHTAFAENFGQKTY